ncbi:hypothetical protein BASA60_001585 [Batrachochytrium salamandrivorans]|nr:hypothetical protein BASA60_001585 [Batrachochytrium salamandrivorans]
MSTLEDIVASLTDRIGSLEIKNQALKQEIFSDNLHEPKAALPNKFDGSRRNFRGFINQLELVFQLQDQRYDTDRKKIATLGTLLTDKALSWFNPYIEQPEHYAYDLSSWSTFKERMKATFGEINQSKYPKPSSGHSDKPFGSTTEFLNGDRSNSTTLAHSDANPPSNQPVFRIHPQQYQQQFVDNYSRHPANQPSAPTTTTPDATTSNFDDMDIDFARRGPLTSSDRQQRFSQELCLVCGQSGHLPIPLALKSNPSFQTPTPYPSHRNGTLSTSRSRKQSRPTLTDLQIPLLELSTPITLRLADGDSSSSLTHRTVPLQLHIGKHVETATFYGKPPNISKTFDSPLAPDTTSNPVELSPIDCSLSNFISLGSMQTDVHPFVKVSPVSDVSIPPDILPNFSLLFSEDRNPILTHRPGKLNSQINSLSCCEDYKANSESSNFQRILTSTGS